MSNGRAGGTSAARQDPGPRCAPRWLERPAAACLRAERDDTRLGDLSEHYVRVFRRTRRSLGDARWAAAAARLTAGVHYVAVAANVVLFARVVDPVLRRAETTAPALLAIDLRERTMTMLRVAAGKLVMPALLLAGSALLVYGAIDIWATWRQTEALMSRLQAEKAEAAAVRIEQYLAVVQSQVGWTTHQNWASAPLDQRRFDFLRLLRQVPAITEVAQLDAAGKEVLRVSRLAVDKAGSGADFAGDTRFKGAQARKVHFGPVHFSKKSEPRLSIALAHASHGTGVTLAEVDLKPLWDAIGAIEFGTTGYAYVVDAEGRLIAHRDVAEMLRQPDLSGLPQVAAALAGKGSGNPVEGRAFDSHIAGAPVTAVHAAVPTPGWRVFVELPVAEAQAPLWGALLRAGGMLGLALVAALLASLVVARRAMAATAAPA